MVSTNVFVFGSALSGLIVAERLSRDSGYQIVVVDKQINVAGQYQGEHLSPSSIRTIRNWGYGDLIDHASSIRLVGIQSFWGEDPSFQDYLISRGGYGACVSQLKMIDVLRERCIKNGVQFHTGRLSMLMRQENHWLVEMQLLHGVKLSSADFIVDATGRGAFLSRRLNKMRLSDRQLAIGCEISVKGRNGKLAHSIVATSRIGWWYLSPTGDSSSVLILHTDMTGAQKIRSTKDLLEAATAGLAPQLIDFPRLHSANRFFRCASGFDFSIEPFEMSFAAVGDAAFAPDPISSSGIAHSFGSACIFAERLSAGLFECADSLSEWNLQHVHQVETHRASRDHLYRSVARWPEATFWRHPVQ